MNFWFLVFGFWFLVSPHSFSFNFRPSPSQPIFLNSSPLTTCTQTHPIPTNTERNETTTQHTRHDPLYQACSFTLLLTFKHHHHHHHLYYISVQLLLLHFAGLYILYTHTHFRDAFYVCVCFLFRPWCKSRQ